MDSEAKDRFDLGGGEGLRRYRARRHAKEWFRG
jgi:hypothetical protein